MWSMVLHSLLFGSLAVSTILSHRGDLWGGPGGGGAVSVKLVGGVSGGAAASPGNGNHESSGGQTKGLYKSEPQPKPKVPPPDTKQIPEFTKEKQPRYVTRPSKAAGGQHASAAERGPLRTGRVACGALHAIRHGQPAGRPTAGMGFSGPGGGDFGGRFSWYVDAVRNRVSSNWLQSTVDPSLRWAPARRGDASIFCGTERSPTFRFCSRAGTRRWMLGGAGDHGIESGEPAAE